MRSTPVPEESAEASTWTIWGASPAPAASRQSSGAIAAWTASIAGCWDVSPRASAQAPNGRRQPPPSRPSRERSARTAARGWGMVETCHGRVAVESAPAQDLHRQGALTGSAGPGSEVQPEAPHRRRPRLQLAVTGQPQDPRFGSEQSVDRAALEPLEAAPHRAANGAADEVRAQGQRSGLPPRGRGAQPRPGREDAERLAGGRRLASGAFAVVIEQVSEPRGPGGVQAGCAQQKVERLLPLRHGGDHKIRLVVDRQVLQRVDDQVDRAVAECRTQFAGEHALGLGEAPAEAAVPLGRHGLNNRVQAELPQPAGDQVRLDARERCRTGADDDRDHRQRIRRSTSQLELPASL